MKELFDLGFTQKQVEEIISVNNYIELLEEDEISKKIDLLKQIGCVNHHIKNIILTNPFFLTNLEEDMIKLCNKLKDLNITHLFLLFDSNPYLFNHEVFEVEEYIETQKQIGQTLEEISDFIESNPYFLE